MNRQLQPELLDELPPNDPRAIHSRRDLRRINAIMRNAHHLQKFVDGETRRAATSLPAQSGPSLCPSRASTAGKLTLLEIGAGDGNISFQLARTLSLQGISGTLLLLDRQPVVNQSLKIPAWNFEVIEADLFDWLPSAPPVDITIANLFLHHFENPQLQILFNSVSKITKIFAACEPGRNRFAPFFARNVWMIGCNEVTCHDAEISVRAGFRDQELSALWPTSFFQSHVVPPLGGSPPSLSEKPPWRLTEHRAGFFTHFFAAVRTQ